MKASVLAYFLLALAALAAPRDVRRVLKVNLFTPDDKLEVPAVAYPEPTLASYPIGDPANGVFITQFDPPPSNPKTLTLKQTKQLAEILADPRTYNPSLGGKTCLFHADVAIRINGYQGGLYVLLCFSCNQIELLQFGQRAAFADMDRGRNPLLSLLRSILPKNKRFKELQDGPEELKRDWAKYAIEWAQVTIPDDPLLKRLLELKPGEISEEDIEELDIRCIAQVKKWGDETAEQQKKDDQEEVK